MPGMELPTKKLVLPVLLLAAFGGLLARWQAPHNVTKKLQISEEQPISATYLTFMTSLNQVTRDRAHKWVQDHPVLGKQKGRKKKPAFWIYVEVTDAQGDGFLRLALRSDNLYVSGFRNRHNEWFVFKGEEETLPGSTALSYTGDYPDIFGEDVGYRGLRSVQVNRAEALANADLLANYRSSPEVSDKTLKPALVFFILTIAEAKRFPSIRDALAGDMEAQTPQTISGELVELVVNWAKLSCALLAWDLGGLTWEDIPEAIAVKEIGVDTPADALRTILPVLRGTRCKRWRP